ncbi:MAG: hypothetical protein ISS45_09115 [Candidatus Omnitrophica bacterium]|nr:hypothetical protein [Candidatus Omnitrophota bacterium]
MAEKSYLLWDFDGVVVDSIDECLITSYNAFLKHQNKSEFIDNLGNIAEKVAKEFKSIRKYVRAPRGYFILHKAIHEDKNITCFSTFEDYFNSHKNEIGSYEDIFYSMRNKLRNRNSQYWINLHHVYPWVKESWDLLKYYFEYFIVSNKDAHSISLILQNAGMAIDTNRIFGKEFNIEKTKIVKHILENFEIEEDGAFFIDDNSVNLQEVSKLSIRLFFASWGYEEIFKTKNDGIITLKKEDFVNQLLEAHEKQVC